MRLDSFGVLMRFFGRYGPTCHMSPRWGLGLWGFGVSIHMSPRWGCVGSFIVVNDLLILQSNESNL